MGASAHLAPWYRNWRFLVMRRSTSVKLIGCLSIALFGPISAAYAPLSVSITSASGPRRARRHGLGDREPGRFQRHG